MDEPPEKTRPRGPPMLRRRTAEQELIIEITCAAEQMAAARDWNGEPVYRTDGVWRVIATIAGSPYCLAIARVIRQRLERDAREHRRQRQLR